MNFTRTNRGFGLLLHEVYPPKGTQEGESATDRLAQHSSAVETGYATEDGLPAPGSSFLWIGDHHHLDREEVAEFVKHLQSWLDTGSLEIAADSTQAAEGVGVSLDGGVPCSYPGCPCQRIGGES